MIKTLYYSLKIDTYYAINSLIYYLRKVPFLRKLFSDELFDSTFFKIIAGFIGVILSFGRMFLNKFIYYLIIFLIASFISKDKASFYHILFFFSIIGMFINNILLNSNTKKYLCIEIFNMNAKDYLRYNLFWLSFTNLIFNTICCFIFGYDTYLNILLVLFQFTVRIIGEAFNIWYFRKYNNFWYNNSLLYFSILIILLGCSFSPWFNYVINPNIIKYALIVSIPLSVISYLYFISYDNYKLLLKRISNKSIIMGDEDKNNRQLLVDVNDKDIEINKNKLENKDGYDYFNTIFFYRHRDVLLRSSRNISIIFIFMFIICGYFIISDKEIFDIFNNLLINRFGAIVLLMLLVNRGSVVTQAMFYNCDHAMLSYNFYRNPKVIIELFKKRLTMTIKINLLPSIVIGLGILILYKMIGYNNIISLIMIFIFIITLGVLFSVHNLAVYYLLQPYDRNLKLRKLSYSIVSIITLLICYMVSKVSVSLLAFSLIGILLCIFYILIALKLVKKYAPVTFKL